MQIVKIMNRETQDCAIFYVKHHKRITTRLNFVLGTIQNSPKIHLQRNKKLALDFPTILNSKIKKDTEAKYIKLKGL